MPKGCRGHGAGARGRGRAAGPRVGLSETPEDQDSSWIGDGASSAAECRQWEEIGCPALARLLSTRSHKLCCVLRRSPWEAGVPQSVGAALCLRSGCSACNPLPCTQQLPEVAGHPPRPWSPWLLPPKMEPCSPENEAMWQRSQTLACNSSNLRAADCCSAINTTCAINKHYLSALVFLMPGHCALACGATRRLKAGFRDESKLA